jgi:thiol-disulfide isomerase/thioredoxin
MTRTRTRWIALTVGVALVAFGIVLAVSHRRETAVPRLVQEKAVVPEFKLTKLDGTTLDSASLKGKAYVVNFWNTWCIPCQQEEPALKQFYESHANERDFAMIGIVREDETSKVRSHVRDHDIGWTIGLDHDGAAAIGFGTTGQPETYVISPDGVAVCGTLGVSTPELLETWLAAARNGKECTT